MVMAPSPAKVYGRNLLRRAMNQAEPALFDQIKARAQGQPALANLGELFASTPSLNPEALVTPELVAGQPQNLEQTVAQVAAAKRGGTRAAAENYQQMKSLAPKLRNQWVSQQRAQMGYPGTALSAIPGLAAWGVIPAPTSGGLRGYQALRPVLLQAAKAAGVPLSWVDDPAFIHLIGDKESGFNPLAQNPRSSAFGIFQFLDATRRTYGIPKTSDPYVQSVAGFQYLRDRYGSPAAALAFHNAHNWY